MIKFTSLFKVIAAVLDLKVWGVLSRMLRRSRNTVFRRGRGVLISLTTDWEEIYLFSVCLLIVSFCIFIGKRQCRYMLYVFPSPNSCFDVFQNNFVLRFSMLNMFSSLSK